MAEWSNPQVCCCFPFPWCVVSESFDPIDFIFAEEIENIKGAILSSARAAGGTHGLLEEGEGKREREREGAQPTSSMITGGREGAVVRVGATFSKLSFQ